MITTGNTPWYGQYSCLENPRDGGAWWAAVYGVAQSWTRLKRLSSLAAAYGLKGSLWEFNLRQSGKSHKVINALQLLFTRRPQDRALEQLTVQGPSHAKGQ